jgi:hypothetical protein
MHGRNNIKLRNQICYTLLLLLLFLSCVLYALSISSLLFNAALLYHRLSLRLRVTRHTKYSERHKKTFAICVVWYMMSASLGSHSTNLYHLTLK